MDRTVAAEVLMTHPVALLALPAFVPVVVIVATILWAARKDRLAEAAERDAGPVPPLAVYHGPVVNPVPPREACRGRTTSTTGPW